MKYALSLSKDGRILSVTYEQYAAGDAVLVESLPEGNVSDYLYIDGEYVCDPLPDPEEPEEQPTPEQRIAELEEALALLLSGVTE